MKKRKKILFGFGFRVQGRVRVRDEEGWGCGVLALVSLYNNRIMHILLSIVDLKLLFGSGINLARL